MDQSDEEISVCASLYKRWPGTYKFVGWAIKRRVNRDALLDALKHCLYKKLPADECWAYCAGTLKITNGNYNAKEYLENQKGVNFNDIAAKLKMMK